MICHYHFVIAPKWLRVLCFADGRNLCLCRVGWAMRVRRVVAATVESSTVSVEEPVPTKPKVARLATELALAMSTLHGGEWAVNVDHRLKFILLQLVE